MSRSNLRLGGLLSALTGVVLAVTASNAFALGWPQVSVPAPPAWSSPGSYTLSARVYANGLSTTAHIQYGASTAYANTSSPQTISGGATTTFTRTTVSMPVGSTVHYRVRANNLFGTTYGPDQTYVVGGATVTGGLRPDAVQSSEHKFLLRGTVKTYGAAATTRIEYGLTGAYGTTVTTAAVPANSTTEVGAPTVSVLSPGTTINYRTVATTADGVVTAGPNQTFTIPTGVVRSVYMYPTDRPFRQSYSNNIANALNVIQAFYDTEVGGKTFTHAATPIACALPQDSTFYGTMTGNDGSWNKLTAALSDCGLSDTDLYNGLVVYADIHGTCPNRIGAGTLGGAGVPNLTFQGHTGLTFMGDTDLQGLDGVTGLSAAPCGTGPDLHNGVASFQSGSAHEMGHTFGLSHPYDQGGACYGAPSSQTCDSALMQFGWMNSIASTHLLPAETASLLSNTFFT